MRWPASTNSRSRSAGVATIVPFPGSARPNASVRQFIELAVNMPEQEPQVGQAERSMTATSASETASSAAATIGPPETNTAGMLRRNAAISMPGVILSQLEMQSSASAQWALTIYSTLSAMISRLGSEYSMPS